MAGLAGWGLWLGAGLKLGLVTWLALWPIRDRLWRLKRWHSLVNLYSLPDSNLDVLAVAWLHTGLLLTMLAQVMTTPRMLRLGARRRPPYARVRRALRVLGTAAQLALLGKAVAVALWGDSRLAPWSGPPPGAGLACMFGSILAALLLGGVEQAAAQALATRWRRRWDRGPRQGVLQPLLPSGGGGNKTRDGAGNMATPGSEGDEEAGTATWTTVWELVRLAAPDTPLLLAAFAGGTAAALGQALLPYYTGKIIDAASIAPDASAFRAYTGQLLAVALACAAATGVRGGLFTVAMARLNVRLRTVLFASLLEQEAGFFDASRTGDISSRLSADTTTVSDQVCLNANVALRSATQAGTVLGFMFAASWRLTVVTLVMVPLELAVCKAYGGYYRGLSRAVQSELAEANSVAEEALASMPTVRTHAAEGATRAAYAGRLARFHALVLREAAAYAAYVGANTFLSAAVAAGVLYYGGLLVLGGGMSPGALVSFMLYQQSLAAAFQALGDVFSALAAAVGAADKVVELIRRRPRVPPAGDLRRDALQGRLALGEVNFAYPARPGHPVLRSLSLSVEPGETVALVGPSGGGKSSVVKLLLRLYLPDSGTVTYDGREVGTYDPAWLRRRVALVSQEPVLYARSVARNIALGLEAEDGVPEAERPTRADVEAAARLAHAHDFIAALPDGYDTECGDRGVQLSGGQKQRIALARALVRRPAVLLLDEATSALDADSEAAVQEALHATARGRTMLVIAHRLSTVRDADRILVVQGGCVVEQGSHDALLAAGGVYAALVRRQLARGGATLDGSSCADMSSRVGDADAGEDDDEDAARRRRPGDDDEEGSSTSAGLAQRSRRSPSPSSPGTTRLCEEALELDTPTHGGLDGGSRASRQP